MGPSSDAEVAPYDSQNDDKMFQILQFTASDIIVNEDLKAINNNAVV